MVIDNDCFLHAYTDINTKRAMHCLCFPFALVIADAGSNLYGSALLGKQQCMRTLCYWYDWDSISEQTKLVAISDATPFITATTATDNSKQVNNNMQLSLKIWLMICK
jgi:hypothetical protein